MAQGRSSFGFGAQTGHGRRQPGRRRWVLWHLHRAIHEREEAENLVLDKLDLQWNKPDYGINPMAPQNPPPLADDQRPPEMEGKGDPAEEKRKHCFFAHRQRDDNNGARNLHREAIHNIFSWTTVYA